MSGERDVEALARLLARVDVHPHAAALDRARAILTSDWYADHEAQIRDLLEEREELLTEIRRLRMGNHPAGRALSHLALAEALTERDAEHEGGEGA